MSSLPPDPPSEPDAIPPLAVPPRDGGPAGAALTIALVLASLVWVGLLAVSGAWRAPPVAAVVAIALAPYVGLGLLVAGFAAWSVLPDRRLLPLALGGVALAGLVQWGPGWPARPEVADGAPVRVLTWNVRRLWGPPTAEAALGADASACVEHVVREQRPDVLALLEVSRADVDQLERDLGLVCRHVDYLGTGDPGAGGLAACSRGYGWTLRRSEAARFRDGDPWRYVLAEFDDGERAFNLLAVHLQPYPMAFHRGLRNLAGGRAAPLTELRRLGGRTVAAQGAQAQALIERVRKLRDPTVVAGDFNSTRDAALHRSLRRHLVEAWEQAGRGLGSTIDLAGWLPLRIDYIYTTSAFAVADAALPDARCSDHRPVVADLVLRGRREATPSDP